MDCTDGDQFRAILLVKVVQIGLMLEIVCIQFALRERKVRLHIIGKLDDIQLIALFFKKITGDRKNFCMRGRRSPYFNDLSFRIGCICFGRGITTGLASS